MLKQTDQVFVGHESPEEEAEVVGVDLHLLEAEPAEGNGAT